MRLMRYVALANGAAVALLGHFAPPTNAPVERLLSNVGAYVKSHPQDANGYYTLGRIHYLAFELNATTLDYWDGEPIRPMAGALPGRAVDAGRHARGLTETERATHLSEALRLLKKSVELEPANGLYELGLACIYEDGASGANASEWREEATRHYLAAFQLSIDHDEKLQTMPVHGIRELVSYEAGESYSRLVRQRGIRPAEPVQIVGEVPERYSEARILKLVEAKIAKLQRLPRGGITPIVLSLRSGVSLADLLAPATHVTFDLDGTGRAQSYPWLQSEAAFLVWDPEHNGRITSGRQLLGTVTWWMFWEDGYHALAALDDDQDGWLTGRELAGLSLWFDRNQNGASDPGEVIPVEQAGIVALAVRAEGSDGRCLMNVQGVRFKDGRLLPSWDWVAAPRE
jgi:hypothetical protein